jgi:hypothetical protein
VPPGVDVVADGLEAALKAWMNAGDVHALRRALLGVLVALEEDDEGQR